MKSDNESTASLTEISRELENLNIDSPMKKGFANELSPILKVEAKPVKQMGLTGSYIQNMTTKIVSENDQNVMTSCFNYFERSSIFRLPNSN